MLGQCDPMIDGSTESAESEIPDRHPELERAEASCKLDAVVAEVHLLVAAVGILQVIGNDPERVAQQSAIAQQKAAGFDRLKEPLVRIERDRVRQAKTIEKIFPTIDKRCRSSIGSIDMQP